MKRRRLQLPALFVPLFVALTPAASAQPLVLEAKISLGETAGRIDHLAVDLARNRLLVAELGNNSVAVVDLANRSVIHRIAGLKEPQGVGYAPSSDLLVVANAGDGSVRLMRAADFASAGMLALGEDADNVRIDQRRGEILVGFGTGALAVLDAASGRKLREIKLPAHPEAFLFERESARVYVNLPDAGIIGVYDRADGGELARWRFPRGAANYAMALDERSRRLYVAYRRPPAIAAFDTGNGDLVAELSTCGDVDDIFIDEKRGRLYLSCGEGAVAVVERNGDAYRELARIPTVSGARTALFVPELDRYYLAVRGRGGVTPGIWIFEPRT